MKLDYLAFAAHPDDVELAMGGTMAMLAARGKSIGVCDLSRGEMGTRGSVDQRKKESEKASKILGLSIRENLGLPDAGIKNTREFQLPIIRVLRKYRPDIVFINAPDDRHPDHGHAAELLIDALFFSGLRQLETLEESGKVQEAWRPYHTFHYMQDRPFEPSIIVDVSDYFEQRLASILAYESQFNVQTSNEEPQTYISSPAFFEQIKARARVLGHQIGSEYGEGFLYHKGPLPAKDFSMFESVKTTR